ncbi:MAG: 1-deoxy-D-xylulose-5-phosphate synthase [Verrucomicrobia subdivision 3 bacterium]|nr:1-deoxy-D-xylulose-5-phosphate synthase [Limisphaerales bacterium]MCS1416389.1 1-deoxy-D-xylulose-5-phosphate synthase [Limisphaerales bacterium]
MCMSRFLDMVDSPDHVKKLTLDQLNQLAGEIREDLIQTLSKNGGHLGPNLGVVELSIALHRCFITPHDKFVWDVSHQTYVHKILTGRKDRFSTIRTTNGLNGFALRTESEHDCYGAAHAGTALSAALGIAAGRDKLGTDEHVVAIFGDAALTNGISFEALNNISETTDKFIGILNDNEWSIAKNVGAIASYLNKLITHPSYFRLQRDFKKLLKRLPKGELAVKLGHRADEILKGTVSDLVLQESDDKTDEDGRGGFGNSLIFEEMGLRYLGPLDGHDLPMLIAALEYAKSCDQPIVLHVLTKKGKGYGAAVSHPEKLHGVGPYDVKTGAAIKKSSGVPAWQEVFGKTMIRLCKKDTMVVGITAAMPSGTGLKILEKEMPDRYYDVGIAEEHAALFACGMATMGFHPVCAIYSTFLQRAYDCIIHDAALQDLPVTFCMDRAGLSPQDGPTHHGMFDISYLRCVPNIIAMAPKDEDELVDMMFTAAHEKHPTFIRYPRGTAEGVPIKETPKLLDIGRAEVISNFENNGMPKVSLFGLGNLNSMAREVAQKLTETGYDPAVINPRFTKPIDKNITEFFGKASDLVVTLEDHVLPGGYGSSVSELFSDRKISTPVVRVGWPDQFIEHATSVGDLREKYGLTPAATIEKIEKAMSAASSEATDCKDAVA